MPEILQMRGGLGGAEDLDTCVEARHPWSAIAVRDGRVVWQTGDDVWTTWRSAAKPLQLACSLEMLGYPKVRSEELAIGAASHSGEPEHVHWVREVLARFDVAERGLLCGTHPPVHVASAEQLLRQNKEFLPIHNNCSGKHAFMLAAAARRGWDVDYRPPEHPLQRLIAERVAEWTAASPKLALDGCGVPTFCLPLSAIAHGWWRMARAMETADEPTRLGAIGRAMAEFPQLTSGTDRLDASVVRHAREPMAAKIGAQGVFCIALPKRDMGLAIKVHSGDSDALPAAVVEALRLAAGQAWQLPLNWRFLDVRNVVGRLAGRYVVG